MDIVIPLKYWKTWESGCFRCIDTSRTLSREALWLISLTLLSFVSELQFILHICFQLTAIQLFAIFGYILFQYYCYVTRVQFLQSGYREITMKDTIQTLPLVVVLSPYRKNSVQPTQYFFPSTKRVCFCQWLF